MLQGKDIDLLWYFNCSVVQHYLNACDISTSACNKVRHIRVLCQNLVLYHSLNIACTDIQYIRSESIL